MPIRRKSTKWDTFILLYLILGILVAGSTGFLIGYYVHYSPAIIIGFIYIIGIFFLLWYSKRNAHEILLSSHICMSFITSYINLKYKDILANDTSAIKLKLMPGYLGKWLEIHDILSEENLPEDRV